MAHPDNTLVAHNKQHSLQQLALLFYWLAPLCGAAGFAANLVRAIDQPFDQPIAAGLEVRAVQALVAVDVAVEGQLPVRHHDSEFDLEVLHDLVRDHAKFVFAID